VRALRLRVARLDDVEGPLQVSAERLGGEDDHVLYAFSIAGDAGELVGGRAAVVLDAAGR
jgi:predicted hotdog family 3-hydroxylacyl-ACP dehydratase